MNRMNRTKSFILLATLTALLLYVGHAIGGHTGLIVALLFAAVTNFGAYWFSDRIVLRMHRAQEVTEWEQPQLYGVVRGVAYRAGISTPRVYIIPEEAPNAFATGRSPEKGAVAVTEGLLKLLNRDELEGVLAHELGHIQNRDTLIMTIAGTLAGALSMLADLAAWTMLLGSHRNSDSQDESGNPLAGLLGILVAPFAAILIQMAISRSREFLADEKGAEFTGSPLSLACALRKIQACSQRIPMKNGSPSTAHLFIVNPFQGNRLARLFATHPSTEERIQRLEQIAMQSMTATA